MKTVKLVTIVLLAFLLGACKKDRPPEEALVQRAFEAFSRRDWPAMKETLITSSDFDLAAQGMAGPVRSQLSYSATLKKEEYETQEKLFAEASEGGDEFVDFENAEFVGLGKLIGETKRQLLSGRSIHQKTFAFKTRDKESGKESDTLWPYLSLVTWKGKPRIIAIVLPPSEEVVPPEADSAGAVERAGAEEDAEAGDAEEAADGAEDGINEVVLDGEEDAAEEHAPGSS